MYKDKEESNKAAKERMRNMRERRNKEGVTSEGVTEPWYPNKRTDDNGEPITPVTLSDGQVWYPLKKTEGLTEEILQNIAQAGRIFSDTEERMGRALRYKEWIDRGKPRSKSVALPNGAYIAVDKLVESRLLFTYLVENLKKEYQDDLRVGVNGPTITECKKLLEVTA